MWRKQWVGRDEVGTVSREPGDPPRRGAVNNRSGLPTLALPLANSATGRARTPCFRRSGTNLAAICGTWRERVAYLARGSRMSARNRANGPRGSEKPSGGHWSRKGGSSRPRKELGPRSRWSPLIPVLPPGPVCRAPLRDPPPRSAVNNRSGVTKLALSLANRATPLAEVT